MDCTDFDKDRRQVVRPDIGQWSRAFLVGVPCAAEVWQLEYG